VNAPRGEIDEEQDVQRLQECRLDREEVAGQHAPPLGSEELTPRWPGPTGRGPEASSAKDPPDGARPDPYPELSQLALDPHAPPPRVLSAQAENQFSCLALDRRSTRGSPAVSPLSPDELAVPAKERLRRDHERGPPVSGEGSARRGEERPVVVFELRASNRATEHPHLVAKHGVLELELRHAPTSGECSDEANQGKIDDGSQGAGDATYQRQSWRSEYWSPTGNVVHVRDCSISATRSRPPDILGWAGGGGLVVRPWGS
jgi:hypothetical protein